MTHNPIRLEERFLEHLRKIHGAKVGGHVTVVHEEMWWAVYVYVRTEHFSPACAKMGDDAYHILNDMWPAWSSDPRDSIVCRSQRTIAPALYQETTPIADFWLPVPPERTTSDFQNFFPSSWPE
jgi:hypothetical protein